MKSVRHLKNQKKKRCSHFDKYGFKSPSFVLHKQLANVFRQIKARCYDDKNKSYKFYGAKGIKVCKQWLDNPNTFIKWALNNGYQKNLSIDRIDSSKDYEPNNCRFISLSENCRRAGKVNWITINNTTMTGRQWSKKINKGINFVNRHIRLFGEKYTIELIKTLLNNQHIGIV